MISKLMHYIIHDRAKLGIAILTRLAPIIPDKDDNPRLIEFNCEAYSIVVIPIHNGSCAWRIYRRDY